MHDQFPVSAITLSNCSTVRPVTGSTRSGAISASGSRTNRRPRKRGCGTTKDGSFVTSLPNSTRSISSVRGAPRAGRSRPRSRSIAKRAAKRSRAGSVQPPMAAALRKSGCRPVTPTGAVSRYEETRRSDKKDRRRMTAKSRCDRRSPRFDPSARAAVTGIRVVTRSAFPCT